MTHLDQTTHAHGASPDPLAHGGWVGAHWPGTLMEATGMEVLEHTAARTVISMPIDGNRQSAGILHGGASLALAETVAGLGSMILCQPDEMMVGMQVSGNHVSSAHEGDTVRAVATVIHQGRSSHVWDVNIYTSTDKLVSSVRVVNSVMKKR